MDDVLSKTPAEVAEGLRAEGHDPGELRRSIGRLMDDMPRRIALRAVADALVPAPCLPVMVVLPSDAEAEPFLGCLKPSFWSGWPGDPSAVGTMTEPASGSLNVWLARETTRERLAERRASLEDALAKRACPRRSLRSLRGARPANAAEAALACDAAIAALDARPVPGEVTLLLPARDRILVTRVKSSDLRAAWMLTSFSAGVS